MMSDESSGAAPTVSVILPTYNRPTLLRRAIASVLRQTYRDFEVLVVDDASEHDPGALVQDMGDERVRLLRHAENRGNAAARNTGIRAARGRFLAFLDDDDEWLPEKLEVQVAVLESSDADEALVYCARRLMENGQVVGVDAPGRQGHVLDDMLPWGLMSCPSVVLKAEVLDTVGHFDERLRRGVDEDLWRRIARSYRVRYVDEVLVTCHGGHSDRVSTVETAQQIREDIYRWEDKLEKFRQEFEERPTRYAIVLRRLGERYIQIGEVGQGRRLLLRAIAQHPLRIDTYGMLAASLFGARGLRAFLRFKEGVMGRVRPHLGSLGGWRRNRYRVEP